MDPVEREAGRLQAMILRWIADVVDKKCSADTVKHKMREWIGDDEQRLWLLTFATLDIAKNLTIDTVRAHTGTLAVAGEGMWTPQTFGSRDPEIVAATQAIIAMLNEDADMAIDIITAHARVSGNVGVFAIALVGAAQIASMLDPNLHEVIQVRDQDG